MVKYLTDLGEKIPMWVVWSFTVLGLVIIYALWPSFLTGNDRVDFMVFGFMMSSACGVISITIHELLKRIPAETNGDDNV